MDSVFKTDKAVIQKSKYIALIVTGLVSAGALSAQTKPNVFVTDSQSWQVAGIKDGFAGGWVIAAPVHTVKLRPATRIFTNFDVVSLVNSGLGDRLVIDKIQTSSREFKTDPEDITALKNAGTSDDVLAAMMHAVPVEQGGAPATTGIQPVYSK
jgi:hypothetical protein